MVTGSMGGNSHAGPMGKAIPLTQRDWKTPRSSSYLGLEGGGKLVGIMVALGYRAMSKQKTLERGTSAPAAPPSALPSVELTMVTWSITPRSSSVPLQ